MEIKFGNLSVNEIEKRCNIKLTDEEKIFLNETRQEKASNIEIGKWHCFDLPFQMVCGDEETAMKVYDILKKYEIHTPFSIAYN